MSERRSVCLAYNPGIPGTEELVTQLAERLGLARDVRAGVGSPSKVGTVCTVQELERTGHEYPGVDLLITVGGDGTILRAAHVAAPHGIAILGINMGRLGFMTELSAQDALERVEQYLDDDLWIEERAMLQVGLLRSGGGGGAAGVLAENAVLCHAVNEAVVGSSAVARMATVKVTIDDYPFTAYRADSVIVATATGSTGYALSAGGPILYPESHDILLKPVAAHLGLSSGLVLPPTSRIKLTLLSGGPATLSVDGFLDYEPAEGDEVVIEASSYRTRFLRMHPPASYYTTLMRRLVPENGGREPRALL